MEQGLHELLGTARAFAAAEVRPLAAAFDSGEGISRELVSRMGALGLLGASLPVKYGGSGADALSWGRIMLEVGKACCSVRSVLTVHSCLAGEAINRLGTEEQREYWLPRICAGTSLGAFAMSEPLTGSDARSIQTVYTAGDGFYEITGVKKWITLGALADFFIVLAQAEGNVSAFIVDSRQDGVAIKPLKGMIGNRGSHIAEITFSGARVPADRLLCGEGLGFTHVVNTAMDHGRHSIAWAAQAVAEEALESMVAYARSRRQFGVPLGKLAAVRSMIAAATVSVHAGRQLCTNAAVMRDQRHPESITETIIAKYFTSRTAVQITNDAVQLHGANGCSSDYKAERLMREAKIFEVIEGTTQVLEDVISDFSLKNYHPAL